ncbi:hypothetical protein I6N95_07620 [Vagococcus sp. BWB3-3]|uniref:Uncharacterized protein n=1 Tax=Vagococcus allomyrinae TaxID=2794353 RepID=A0A940PA00_9ENTE|nr:hypothetical protein [Vagococcus allomyrinae]MBP1040870.1 hypothetical protein [Vagococcus allomyrinae]
MNKYRHEKRYKWSDPQILALYPQFSSQFITGIESLELYTDYDEWYSEKLSYLKITFKLIDGIKEKLTILFKDVSSFRLEGFGGGYHPISGFDIIILDYGPGTTVQYEVIDYEDGALFFYFRSMEVLSFSQK